MNILLILLTSSFLNFYPVEVANVTVQNSPSEVLVKKDKDKKFRKKKHWLKKLIMGKRYCECPKY